MNQPSNKDQPSSPSRAVRVTIVLVLLGAGMLLLITLVFFAVGGRLPAFSAAQVTAPTVSINPTMFIPTPDCGPATLVLGAAAFQMQVTQLAPDGSVSVPPNDAGTAYWVEGTDLQYIFMLSPTPENVALVSALPAGSIAKATWSNCNSMTFSLSAAQPGSFGVTYLPDQSTASIAIFVQTDASGNGLVIGGALTEEQISTFDTPASNGTDVQAEIGLLETTTSADGATVTFSVSIYNYGISAITVSAGDLSLTPPGGPPLTLTDSKPSLPEEIGPAETKTFTFTFPRPATSPSTLRIFTVEYDIE